MYVDLLEVVGRLADNAMTWSAVPLAELSEAGSRAPEGRARACVRVVAGSDPVF